MTRILRGAAGYALGAAAKSLDAASAQAVVADLRQALKDADADVQNAAARAIAVAASRAQDAETAGTAFLSLDAYKGSRSTTSDSGGVRRTLASANWRHTDDELLDWLTREAGQYRAFAAHVLAQRQPLDTELLARIHHLRDDPQGRPWVKMAALRSLVEIERERLVRKRDAKKEQRGNAEDSETED